jgi:hypothetical protein
MRPTLLIVASLILLFVFAPGNSASAASSDAKSAGDITIPCGEDIVIRSTKVEHLIVAATKPDAPAGFASVMTIVIRDSVVKKLTLRSCRVLKIVFVVESSLFGQMFFNFHSALALTAVDSHFTGQISLTAPSRYMTRTTADISLKKSYFFDAAALHFLAVARYNVSAENCVFASRAGEAAVLSHLHMMPDDSAISGSVEASNVTFRQCIIASSGSTFVSAVARSSHVRFERCRITSNATCIAETFHGLQLAFSETAIEFVPFIKTPVDPRAPPAFNTIAMHAFFPTDTELKDEQLLRGISLDVSWCKVSSQSPGLSIVLVNHASFNNSRIRFRNSTVDTLLGITSAATRGEGLDVPSQFCFMCRERDIALTNITVLLSDVAISAHAANMYLLRMGGPVEGFVVVITNSRFDFQHMPRNPFGSMIRFDSDGHSVAIRIKNSNYSCTGQLCNGLTFFGPRLQNSSVLVEESSVSTTSVTFWFNRVLIDNVTVVFRSARLMMTAGWGISVQQSIVKNLSLLLTDSIIHVASPALNLDSCALCLSASRMDSMNLLVRRSTIAHPSIILYLSDQGGNVRQRGAFRNVSALFENTVFLAVTEPSGPPLDAVLKVWFADVVNTQIFFIRCVLDIRHRSYIKEADVRSIATVTQSEINMSSIVFEDFMIQFSALIQRRNIKNPVIKSVAFIRSAVIWDTSISGKETVVFRRLLMRRTAFRSSLVQAVLDSTVGEGSRAEKKGTSSTYGSVHFQQCSLRGDSITSTTVLKTLNSTKELPKVEVVLADSFLPCFAGLLPQENKQIEAAGCVQVGDVWVEKASGNSGRQSARNQSSSVCAGKMLHHSQCDVREETLSLSRTRTHRTPTKTFTRTLLHSRTLTFHHPRNPNRQCPLLVLSKIDGHSASRAIIEVPPIVLVRDFDRQNLDFLVSLRGIEGGRGGLGGYKWRSESLAKHVRVEVEHPFVFLERRQHGERHSMEDGTRGPLPGVDVKWSTLEQLQASANTEKQPRLEGQSIFAASAEAGPLFIRLSHSNLLMHSFPFRVVVTVSEDLIDEGCRDDFVTATVSYVPLPYNECMSYHHLVALLVTLLLVLGLVTHRLHVVVVTAQILNCTACVGCFSSSYNTCMQLVLMHGGSLSPFRDPVSVVLQNCGIATGAIVVEFLQEVAAGSRSISPLLSAMPSFAATAGWSRSLAIACVQAAILPSFDMLHNSDSDERLRILGGAGVAFSLVLLAVCFWMMQGFASQNVFFLIKALDQAPDLEAGENGATAACCVSVDAPLFCWPVGRWAQRRAVLDDVERRKETYALLPCLLVIVLSWISAIFMSTNGAENCRFASNTFVGTVAVFVLIVSVVRPFRLMSTQLWVMLLLLWVVAVVELKEHTVGVTILALSLGCLEAALACIEVANGHKWRAARQFDSATLDEESLSRVASRKAD